MLPQERLAAISSLLAPVTSPKRQRIYAKNSDDIVITLALRTPLTKAKKGYLKDTKLDQLLLPLLVAVKEGSNLDPARIEEIVLGNVLCPGAPYVIRSAALAAGFPVTTAASLVSRWCSSGLLAVQSVANQISSGSIDIGLAIGAESMSSNPDNGAPEISPELLENQGVRDADMPMGWTSENVASEFNISREAQDEFAARSFQRAERSQKAGWPVDEIVPLTVHWTNPKTGTSETVVVDRDDGIRYGTTAETLAKIKPAFPKWKPSTTTGGNASQITDGAAAILLMRRSTAEELGQPVLAKFAASTVIAIEPRIMGIGPTIAIPKLFKQTGLTKEDVDIFEINEAFASMSVYCVEKLGLDPAKVNPRGGAIAFGHPLGCTGARQIVTALSELKRTGGRVAITSMCVGTGMGMAGLIISEQHKL